LKITTHAVKALQQNIPLKGDDMKTSFLTKSILLAALALSSAAMASDLTKDLKTPFDVMTNPFQAAKEMPLSPKLKNKLVDLLQGCTLQPVRHDGNNMEIWDPAQVKPECKAQLILEDSKGHDGFSMAENRLRIFGPHGLEFSVVQWDGSYSDGGDQQAIGIYDSRGKRIAVYPSLYVDGNVLTGLSAALDFDITKTNQ
jgi:hypothetical protein